MIQFTDDATFWRHSRQVALDAFVPVDEVVVQGRWVGDAFMSYYLTTLYRCVVGNVIRRTANILDTTGGTVYLTAETVPWSRPDLQAEPLSRLAVGDEVVALGWRDARSGRLVAGQIAVQEAA